MQRLNVENCLLVSYYDILISDQENCRGCLICFPTMYYDSRNCVLRSLPDFTIFYFFFSYHRLHFYHFFHHFFSLKKFNLAFNLRKSVFETARSTHLERFNKARVCKVYAGYFACVRKGRCIMHCEEWLLHKSLEAWQYAEAGRTLTPVSTELLKDLNNAPIETTTIGTINFYRLVISRNVSSKFNYTLESQL